MTAFYVVICKWLDYLQRFIGDKPKGPVSRYFNGYGIRGLFKDSHTGHFKRSDRPFEKSRKRQLCLSPYKSS